MLRRRFPVGLVAPIALVVLIAALGALQYRWVGQVSERERDQLRQSLDRRAADFANDFDREIGRTYQVFGVETSFMPASAGRFAKQHDEWLATSPFVGILKTAYFAQAVGGDFTLHRYAPGSRQFEEVPWPDTLAAVRARLVATRSRMLPAMSGPGSVIAFGAPSVMPAVPAIVIPETLERSVTQPQTSAPPAPGTTVSMRMTVTAGGNYIVLELDRAFIAATMLPALVERHFPETGSDRYRVSVTGGTKDVLFSRGLAAGQSIAPEAADAAARFFGLRVEMFRGLASTAATVPSAAAVTTWTAARQQDSGAAATEVHRVAEQKAQDSLFLKTAPTTVGGFSMVIEQNATALARAPLRSPGSEWALLLQHSAGSLDAAVTLARRRNLFLSFGILSVLAASVGLVMVNARRSEKLAAQQMDFVATVSHELRTPLAVIRSAAQNLSAGVIHDPSQARRYGDLIEAEGRRLTDMVEQVLEYAGLSDTKRRPAAKPMDADHVVRDVVAASSSLPEAAGVQFDVRIDDDLPAILAEEDAIRRSLHNLIGNALKYAGAGRWVGVTASRGTGGDEAFVRLAVADHGGGIASGDLGHIFEPFYRGRQAIDQQIRGNGLGLSLVKHIVESHGGRVSVNSTSEGSTFALCLPIATGAASTETA